MKRETILLCIVTVLLMLFAAIEVMAECPETSCTTEGGVYTITFNGVYMTNCKDATGATVPCYDYRYHIAGPMSTFNQGVALIPVCCEDPIITYPSCSYAAPPCSSDATGYDFGGKGQIYAPGAGDPTSKLGYGVGMVYAIRTEPNPSLPDPHLYSSSSMTGPISIQIKSGSKYYYCKNIVGPRCPDCGKEAHIPSVVEKLIHVESGCVRLSISSDKCVQELSLCDANCNLESCVPQEAVYLTVTSQGGDTRITNETLREISDTDGNQRCAWGRLYIGNNTCQSLPSGTPGKYFLWGDTCKCTSTTQCYPPKTCQGGICKNPL